MAEEEQLFKYNWEAYATGSFSVFVKHLFPSKKREMYKKESGELLEKSMTLHSQRNHLSHVFVNREIVLEDIETAMKTLSSQEKYLGGTVSKGNEILEISEKYVNNSVCFSDWVINSKKDNHFNSSSFVVNVYNELGINLVGDTETLKRFGEKIPFTEIKVGDLVFFSNEKAPDSVGIYAGDNKFIGCFSKHGVTYNDFSSADWSNNFSGDVVRIK